MLSITCYGGVGEIGGNKILLEDSGASVMLDFGKSFSGESRFFDEFLKPRTNSALRDLLALELLPPIPGIYRHDMLKHAGAWDVVRDELPKLARGMYESDLESYEDFVESGKKTLDGILLSHAHADHVQSLCFIDPNIPVYCTQATYDIMRAVQEVGTGSYESDICECRIRSHEPSSVKSTFPGTLRIVTDKSSSPRDIRVVEPFKPFDVGDYKVKAIPVDHSVPGACAFLIKAPSGKIVVYTGDLRFHGRFSLPPHDLTSELRRRTKGLQPDVLITEGTRIKDSGSDSEKDVEDNIRSVVESCDGLVIVDFGWKDTSRFETILNVARATKRTLAVSPKLAYLWSLLRASNPDGFPDLEESGIVRVYLERTGSMTYSPGDYTGSKYKVGTLVEWDKKEMPAAWEADDMDYLAPRLCHYYNGVRAFEIAADPSKYMLHGGYFDIAELFDLNPPRGRSVFIRAATDPFSEEMRLDAAKLANWLRFFGIKSYGVEEQEGDAREILSHVSGHATGSDLLPFIKDMRPKMVIPVHTEAPEVFERELAEVADVALPELQRPIKVP